MLKTLRNYFFLLKFVARYTNYVWWSVADGIIWGIYNSFTTVVFIKYLFDWIEQGRPFGQIMLLVAVMGAYMMLIYVFHENFYNFVRPKAQQRLHEKMHSELFKKVMSLDISCYDNPEFYNEYVWMLNQFEDEVMDVAFDIGKFINRILSSAVIITLIASIDIAVVFAIVFAVIVSVALKYFRTKLYYNRQADLKPSERKGDYVGRVFYLADYAEEIRMSGVSGLLVEDFDEAVDEQIRINKHYGKKLFLSGILRDFSSSILINVGIITLLVYKIMVEKSIMLGDFAASLSGTWTLFWQLNNLLDYFAKLKGHSLFAERLRTFLSCESKLRDAESAGDIPSFEELTLKDMSFTYPGADRETLKDISLSIRRNEKIALVGYNGAGKSTLVKLIMRLYDPTGGELQWNGKNIKNYKSSDYRTRFGAVFQDFQTFAVTIGENIKGDVVSEDDKEEILQAAQKSGLSDKLTELPKGIDTQLTREFDKDGVNLSGGELQKLAIARALMKDSDIIILDEPSSALDPISEYELNQAMMNAALDKTVIFISHRLSTTIMADRIYMLEEGRIIEQGNHMKLMSENGKYAEMFRLQAEKYQYEVETI